MEFILQKCDAGMGRIKFTYTKDEPSVTQDASSIQQLNFWN